MAKFWRVYFKNRQSGFSAFITQTFIPEVSYAPHRTLKSVSCVIIRTLIGVETEAWDVEGTSSNKLTSALLNGCPRDPKERQDCAFLSHPAKRAERLLKGSVESLGDDSFYADLLLLL
ncbi:hypothetical protein CEXT_156491 [Caerostris extrusa]|uniref:Uncharacterized protein n=1 Tax=Caerostris extrusa TaxID=172846 RepID=A0AAV4TVX9_CAEEX|nr:hypothetical protein CEXT_156491 [Caerostris extrusa]